MRSSFGRRVIAMLLPLVCAASARAEAPRGKLRYYVVVQSAADQNGAQSAMATELRDLFIEQLQHRADVALERPAWLPTEPAAMKLEMARRGMRAYDAHLKILRFETKVTRTSDDSPRRTVSVDLAIQLFGNTLPDRELKIGGDGGAETTATIGKDVDLDATVRRLFLRVARPAIDQAIEATVQKIELVAERQRLGKP